MGPYLQFLSNLPQAWILGISHHVFASRHHSYTDFFLWIVQGGVCRKTKKTCLKLCKNHSTSSADAVSGGGGPSAATMSPACMKLDLGHMLVRQQQWNLVSCLCVQTRRSSEISRWTGWGLVWRHAFGILICSNIGWKHRPS